MLLRSPITGIAGFCARAASGHAIAAPPSSDMNSRRSALLRAEAEHRAQRLRLRHAGVRLEPQRGLRFTEPALLAIGCSVADLLTIEQQTE